MTMRVTVTALCIFENECVSMVGAYMATEALRDGGVHPLQTSRID
jgi:hypothetical protein